MPLSTKSFRQEPEQVEEQQLAEDELAESEDPSTVEPEKVTVYGTAHGVFTLGASK